MDNINRRTGCWRKVRDANMGVPLASRLRSLCSLRELSWWKRRTNRRGCPNAAASQAKVESGKWQELRVEARGQTLRGFLNGQLVVETMDSTFSVAGGVGLWTKADSQTCFDDVEVSVPSA